MSKREKSTILYSRNGIKIERIDFLDMTKYENQKNKNVFITKTVNTSAKKKDVNVEVIPATKAWDEIIKRKSKLGFYYYQTIHHDAKKQEIKYHDIYGSATYKHFIFQYDNKRFILSYPISCGDVKVSREMRPWDILPGYTGIEDHFINDLYKEANKFFEVAEVNKVGYRIKEPKYGWHNDTTVEYATNLDWLYNFKKEVMKDLFGDEKGPTINYNDIKIVSHGFDTKISFRKRKEE